MVTKRKVFFVKKKLEILNCYIAQGLKGWLTPRVYGFFFSENHVIDRNFLVFLANIYYFE